jgi:hypothetical protein
VRALAALVAFAGPYEPTSKPITSCLTNQPVRIAESSSFNRCSGSFVLSLQVEQQWYDLGAHLDARIVLEDLDETWDHGGCGLARFASQRVQRDVSHKVHWVA